MVHVMLAKFQEKGVFDAGEKVNGIMNHVINQIAEHETAEKRPGPITE